MLVREITEINSEWWADDKWSFVLSPGKELVEKPVTIDFEKICLSIGGLENSIVMNDLKQLAVCWIGGLDGRRKSAPATVLNKIRIIARFYRGVSKEGVERLCLLTQKKVEEILFNHILSDTKNLRTVSFVCSVIRDLYLFKDWLVDGLPKDPFTLTIRGRLLSGLHNGDRWNAPDEPSSLLLLAKALEIIDSLPGLVLPRLRLYAQYVAEANKIGLDSKKRVSNYVLNKFSKMIAVGIDGLDRERQFYNGLDLNRPADLALLVKRLQDACFVVLTYTSGFRVSELRRMTSKSLIWREHINGDRYPYLVARRSKKRYSAYDNSSGGTLDSNPWVISPGGVKAFAVLVELSALVRDRSGVDNVWACYAGNGLWPLRSSVKRVSVPSGGVFNSRLNKFAIFVGLTDASGWKYRLHSHMGRKHFARYIVKRDRSGLGALALQYSHASAVSVDVSYAMPDAEFRRLIQDELATAMDSVVQELAGQDPERIYYSNKSGRSVQRFMGSFVKEKDAKRLIATGTLLIPCQWGYCDYEKTQSSCSGGELPNPVRRTPEVCSSCPNFIATSVHEQWWREYLNDSERVLKLSSIPKQTVELLKARAEKAREVLSFIGGGDKRG